MAETKFVTIRTFLNDNDRDEQFLERSKVWDKIATNPEELTNLMAEAHQHPTHKLVSFYDELGNHLADYPAAGKHLGGKEGLWGYFY